MIFFKKNFLILLIILSGCKDILPGPEPYPKPVDINILGYNNDLYPGDTIKLTVQVIYSDGSSKFDTKVNWYSKREDILTIDSYGLLTSKSSGETEVIASLGDVKGYLLIEVKDTTLDLLSVCDVINSTSIRTTDMSNCLGVKSIGNTLFTAPSTQDVIDILDANAGPNYNDFNSWMASDVDYVLFNYEQALSYCEKLNNVAFLNRYNWRLPLRLELLALNLNEPNIWPIRHLYWTEDYKTVYFIYPNHIFDNIGYYPDHPPNSLYNSSCLSKGD